MKNMLFILGGLTLLAGCGVEKKREPFPGNDIITSDLNSSPSVLLKKQQTSCGSKSFLPAQLDLSLHFFLGGTIQSETQNFASLFSGLNLQSPKSDVINESLYNMDVEVFPRGKFLQVKTHNSGEALTVCPEVEDFERDSVESAGLNIAYVINKTYRAATAADKSLVLAPVGLNVSPNIRKTYLKKNSDGSEEFQSEYETNNAFYRPDLKTVTFLPHSVSWRAMNTGVSFWEVPMVGSHEYAHHIFQTLAAPELVQKSDARHTCFGSSEALIDQPDDTSSDDALTPNATILAGYNEGFADLVSYYSLDDQERSVRGVPCLQVTRDVGSATFIDGQVKSFTKNAVDAFVRPKSFLHFGCEQTDFKDAHTFGSIFAHNADSFLGQLTGSKTQKLAGILAWARSIKDQRNSIADLKGEKYLKALYVLFLRSSVKSLGLEMKNNCLRAELTFPGITKTMNECLSL